MAVTEFTTAISGAGKSYRRCAHFLATEYLPQKTGKIWTNFPIHIDEMIDYVIANNPNMVAEDLRDRIRIIPEAELSLWRKGDDGPWNYFKGKDISGDRIAIDEVHNYCPKEASRETARNWKEWLGELRHSGAEFECLSQNEAKVHPIIKNEAGLKRTLFNCEDRREPFFGVKMSDWYNLRAKFFTGAYTAAVFEYEFLPLNGKWHQHAVFTFSFKPEFYALYDSYSTPVAGGSKARAKIYPFQEHGRLGLLWWFIRRNYGHLSFRLIVVVLGLWVCFFGGGAFLIDQFMQLQRKIMVANAAKAGSAQPGVQQTGGAVAGSSSMSPVVGTTQNPGGSSVQSQEIANKLKVTEKENEELRKKLDEMEKENARKAEIVLFGQGYVMLRDGQRYITNEKIKFGPLTGHSFTSINHRKRYATLDDGTVICLSH